MMQGPPKVSKGPHLAIPEKLWRENQANELILSEYVNLHWLTGTAIRPMEASEVTTEGRYRVTQ